VTRRKYILIKYVQKWVDQKIAKESNKKKILNILKDQSLKNG
jgi:hypothetical protein